MAAALPFISAGMSVLSTAASAARPILEAQSANVRSNAAADQAEQEAHQTLEKTAQDKTALEQTQREQLGKHRTQIARSGLTESGSPTDTLLWEQDQHASAIDQLTKTGALTAARYQNQARMARADIINRNRMANFQAGTTLLQGMQSWVRPS